MIRVDIFYWWYENSLLKTSIDNHKQPSHHQAVIIHDITAACEVISVIEIPNVSAMLICYFLLMQRVVQTRSITLNHTVNPLVSASVLM